MGGRRLRGPPHDERELSRLRVDVRAAAECICELLLTVLARYRAAGAARLAEGEPADRDVPVRQLHLAGLRRTRLVHLRSPAALRHELLRVARPRRDPLRGV